MSLSQMTLEDYLEGIRTRSDMIQSTSNNTWRYPNPASATHDWILKKLSPEAKDLLFMLAFMNSDDIDEGLFKAKQIYDDVSFLHDKTK